VVAGELLAGEGVELTSDRVQLSGDVHRRTTPSALEEQVLQEVGGAPQRARLIARAHVDPEPYGCRAGAGHRLGHDAKPSRENGAADRGSHGPTVTALSQERPG
jgi:hypothetical protein